MITHADIARKIADTAYDLALRYMDQYNYWDYVVAMRRAANRLQHVYGPTMLSKEELAKRAPPPPDELVGALQDNIHKDLGVQRVAGQQWIKCSEKMPEPGKLVIFLANKHPEIGRHMQGVRHGAWRNCCTTFVAGEVTHWMPLIELPKGE